MIRDYLVIFCIIQLTLGFSFLSDYKKFVRYAE